MHMHMRAIRTYRHAFRRRPRHVVRLFLAAIGMLSAGMGTRAVAQLQFTGQVAGAYLQSGNTGQSQYVVDNGRGFDQANVQPGLGLGSIAARVEKRPVGELHVIVLAPNPDYTFDPELFPESPEAQQLKTKLKLPPGPNNPVGVAWIGLDKTGYGIHGTPNPEQVGRTESHGCFRLANWDAEYLIQLAWEGMPVLVEP